MLILDDLITFVKQNLSDLPTPSGDGRLNSIFNENKIKELCEKFCKDKEIAFNNSKERSFYDIKVDKCYCNIKISACQRADNCSSKKGVFYALTGVVDCPDDYDAYSESLFKNLNFDLDSDYYFLIINKNNFQNSFWTSLKRIKTLVPNGNNLPFQCNWGKNREFSNREKKNRLSTLDTFKESLRKRSETYMSFKKHYERFIKKERECLTKQD